MKIFKIIFIIPFLLFAPHAECSLKLREDNLCRILVTTLDIITSNKCISGHEKKYYSKILYWTLFENFVVYDSTGIDNLRLSDAFYKGCLSNIQYYINRKDPCGFLDCYKNDKLNDVGETVMKLRLLSNPHIFDKKEKYILYVNKFNAWLDNKIL